MVMSNMQCQLEGYNSNQLIHEMTEKLKDRSNSKMCLVPSIHHKHSDVLESQDSETNLDKSKQCSNSLTPANKSRSRIKNLFRRETKPTLKPHKVNLQCTDGVENSKVPPPKDHPGEPYNLYYVPAGDDEGSPPNFISRNVSDESGIYEEVCEPIPSNQPFDKSSSIEDEETQTEASEYNVIAMRPLPVDRKNMKPPYITVHNSATDSEASSELEGHLGKSWGNMNNYNLYENNPPMVSPLCNVEPSPIPPLNVPSYADPSADIKPPPVLPKAAYIKRSSSQRIHQEWCKLKNDYAIQPQPNKTPFDKQVPADKTPLNKPVPPDKTSLNKSVPPDRTSLNKSVPPDRTSLNKSVPPDKTSLNKPVPPVPAQRRLPSLTPKEELPEIEAELQLFRALLKKQKHVNITEIVISNINFTGRMLDSKGGRLLLESHGVVLYIPPDALGDEPQEIFIYVQQNLTSSDHTVKDGFVTPIVHCGTSGLKFKIPVILTFPVHVKDSSQWELTGVRQDSSTKPWTDISDCSTDTVLVNDKLCTVIVDHFTGFGLVGRPRDTQASGILPLRVGVFISQKEAIDPKHGCVQLRVRMWDESPGTDEFIKNTERGSKLLDTSRRFFLHTSENGTHDADLDVTVALKGLNQPWKTSFKKQVFSLARFEVHHQVEESCTLNLKTRPQDAAMDSDYQQGLRPLECDISIYQRCYENFAVTFCAVDEIGVRSGRDSTGHRNMSIGRLDDFYPMSPGRYRELSRYLDSERRWKLLVKPCFIGDKAMLDFDQYCYPSAVLLGIIFSQGSIRGSSIVTLENLRSMLSECKLVRAAHIVRKDIDELRERLSGKENGGIFVHPIQCSDTPHSLSEAKLHRSSPIFVNNDDLYEAIPSDVQSYDTVNEIQSLPEAKPNHLCSPPTFVENHHDLYEAIDGQNDVRPKHNLQDRKPEENDEFPDQMHTLQSNQFFPRNTGPNNSVIEGSFHLARHHKPEPTQDNWPSENSQESPGCDDELYCSVPQNNNHYQNLPKSNISQFETSSYVSLGNNKLK